MRATNPELRAFASDQAKLIASWVADADELERWCGLTDHPLRTAALLAWHVEDVAPFVLCEDDEPVAYGEVWVDLDEQEVEFARLIVAPTARHRGVGRLLVLALVQRARRFALPHAYMRVHADNRNALRCYAAAGFRQVSAEGEAAFNRGQPHDYTWLRRRLFPAD